RLEVGIGRIRRVVRMDPDRGVNVGPLLRETDGCGIRFAIGTDGHEAHDTGRASAVEHGLELAGELGEVEMSMRVEERHQPVILLQPVGPSRCIWSATRPARTASRQPGGYGVTANRNRPMSCPEAVTTSAV